MPRHEAQPHLWKWPLYLCDWRLPSSLALTAVVLLRSYFLARCDNPEYPNALLLARILAFLPCPLSCAYCRLLSTPWPEAKPHSVQLENHVGWSLLYSHFGSIALFRPPPNTKVFISSRDARPFLISILGRQKPLSSMPPEWVPLNLSGVSPFVHRSVGFSFVPSCWHCDGSVTICISPKPLARKG